MKWSCCQDEVVSECSWYVEDSKERKKQPRRKENRSVWAIKIALSHAHWIYPFTRARVSSVVTARVVTCIWLSEISGVHPWWCVCALSRYGSRYLTVYKRIVQHTKKPIEEERMFWRWRRSPDIVYSGQLSTAAPLRHVLCIRCAYPSMKKWFQQNCK